MKLLLSTLVLIFIFSGCSTKKQNHRLRTKNAQQSAIIQQQQAKIAALNARLKAKKIAKKSRIQRVRSQTHSPKKTSPAIVQKAPKKEIKLKKVEDSNYSSNYMYPQAKKQAPTPNITQKPTEAKKSITSTMTRTECIGMIGTEKFTKYTQMFGSESASLKRCKMLKAMKQ